jgi:26S proteasome regulatory subunit T4
LDRKIEIPLPNEVGRLEIMKIHAAGVVTEGDFDFERVVKMSDGLNGRAINRSDVRSEGSW